MQNIWNETPTTGERESQDRRWSSTGSLSERGEKRERQTDICVLGNKQTDCLDMQWFSEGLQQVLKKFRKYEKILTW